VGNLFYFGADLIAFAKFLLLPRLGAKWGEVWVDFGTPICIKDIVDIEANFKASARDEMSGHQASMKAVCGRLRTVLQSLYRLLPEHVVAGVLAENPNATEQAAAERARVIVERLRAENRNLKSLDGLTPEQIVAKGVKQLRRVKAVSVKGQTLAIRKRSIIEYYAAALSE